MANGNPPPYGIIAQALRAGEVVPFLGAGASAVYRPEDDRDGWNHTKLYLPFGAELALRKLAPDANFPQPDLASNLGLVASYYEHVEGDRPSLNLALRQTFCRDYQPGTIHRLLAQIDQPLLVVTTNYDDLIEQAFRNRPFHLVVDRGDKSRVWVGAADAFEAVKITDLRKALVPEDRPIIYKLHGSIDKKDGAGDRFVITEEDYVDILGRAQTFVPPYLATRMAGSRFLFLGYSLLDWNVRVMLRKLRQPLRAQDDRQLRCWPINKSPGNAERRIWDAHRVNIYDLDIRVFVDELAGNLGITADEPGS
jgi:SIR2-like domain